MVLLTKLKTLYSLTSLSYNSFMNFNITILFFSMAGVPPFIGFFSKLFILLILLNTSFFIFYFLFFILLFMGLYFYIQNIRFLQSTNYKSVNLPQVFNERVLISYYYFSINFLFFIILGFIYVDDLILFFS